MKKALIVILLLVVAVLMIGKAGPLALLPFCLLGMAKVDGPLFSLEAKGKIGDALVFFPWKGRHAVRRWLKPTNPRDIDQKLIRQKLAAVGQTIGKILGVSTDYPNGSLAVVQWKTLTPATNIWNAYIVKKSLTQLSSDAKWILMAASIAGADELVTWQSCALDMGMPTLYATADPYATDVPPEEQLAAVAFAAVEAGYSDVSIDASGLIEDWGTADISLFVSNMLTDAV